MALSMHQAFIPVVTRVLGNLSAILDKAAADAEARKYDPGVLVNARLAPDMHPLSRQVQIATDVAKAGAARLAGVEAPSYADTEASIDELKARLAKTIDYLNGFGPEKIDGTEDKDITLKIGPNELHLKGQAYLLGFVLPNVYFHVTTAYAILRHNGVAIGKRDFLGGV
jgi:hypothetical protein